MEHNVGSLWGASCKSGSQENRCAQKEEKKKSSIKHNVEDRKRIILVGGRRETGEQENKKEGEKKTPFLYFWQKERKKLRCYEEQRLSDIWRKNISFNDLQSVSLSRVVARHIGRLRL